MGRTLEDIGELAAIARITRSLPTGRGIVKGAGDDCAVLRFPGDARYDWLLTSDPVIEGVHFTSATPAGRIGRKAVGRVLSDIAAMGGQPAWALLNIVAPRSTPVARLDALYAGASRLAAKHGLAIVGGDMASGPVLEVHAFAVGAVPRGAAILRSGSRPGDLIFVTGRLGGSRKGHHLAFDPRMQEGAWLRGWARAMIDVSDGLASDLRHLTDMSGTGARLELARIPVSRAAAALRDGLSPVQHALFDGEDFELLFTLPARKRTAFLRAWQRAFALPCTWIGAMTGRAGRIECAQTDGTIRELNRAGYQHFA